MSGGPSLVLLGRPGCGLCEEMREVVDHVIRNSSARLAERNIEADPELLRAYVLEIPVLLVDGEEIARHRIDAATLRSRLLARGLELG